MNSNEGFSIQDERAELEKDLETLECTEGFSRLSIKQQRIIKQSLYIQARAERGTDEASAWAIVSKERGYVIDSTHIHNTPTLERFYLEGGPNPNDRKYANSQIFVANYHCHSAIFQLENELPRTLERPKLPQDFFLTDYYLQKQYEDVVSLFEGKDFPQVLHVLSHMDTNHRSRGYIYNEGFHTDHSALVLGHDKDGDLLVWEKEGDNLPFRLTKLKQVYDEYSKSPFWGIRDLKVHKTD